MHRVRVLFLFLFVTVSAFAQDARIREFAAYAEQMMKLQQMPGLSMAVVSGDFRWAGGFGLADLENGVPATAESSYRMASVTKPMTAIAILRLADEGKLDLDAEVQTYVPYFPRKAYPITIRQLLAHQGGISHYKDYMKEGRLKEPKTTREAIALFADFDLVAEPGTKYSYTSYGFNLLGAVVEEVSRQPYGVYLTDNVWKPLGMTSTRMDDPRDLIPHRVDGYTLGEDGRLRRSEYVDISSRFGGGGSRSTVGDMIRLFEGLGEGKVLKAGTREQAWSMQPTRDQRYTRYGLGFGLYSRNGRAVVAHGGSQQETRTSLMYIPAAHFAVALASNFEDADLDPFEEKLVELFLGDPHPVNVRAARGEDQKVFDALQSVYTGGLAYYDRHGRPMTTDSRELSKAFRYLLDALAPDEKRIADGAHPVSGEPFVKVGSYMASVLAANGGLDPYHDGPLHFFADYARVATRYKLDKALVRRVDRWQEAWTRVWTPELRALTFYEPDALDIVERNRAALVDAPLRPDFSRALKYLAEGKDAAVAARAKELGAALYP
jgi:CubicO group peptidase (beta-lactamase class C family)